MESASRIRGCLLGLAVGDALGTTLEFSQPGSFDPLTDMVGGGPFKLLAGQFTDDTSLALCIAESLIMRREFDATDQMSRFARWYREGHLSSNGKCFDIGMTTRSALMRFESEMKSGGSDGLVGSTQSSAAGNGSLMRLAPVPIFFAKDAILASQMSGKSSLTTHGAAEAVDACKFFSALLLGAFQGISKSDLLSPHFYSDFVGRGPLSRKILEIAEGSYKSKNPPEIVAGGYVVTALEAALWAFHNSQSFKEGCLMAVNLGNDADTVGAIFGQIGGMFYGVGGEFGIPDDWVSKITFSGMIEEMADTLYSFACGSPDTTAFESTHLCYSFLEKAFAEVLRRIEPCPRQYTSTEEFDSDIQRIEKEYEAEVPESPRKAELLFEFQRIWDFERKRVEQRARATPARSAFLSGILKAKK